MVFGRPTRRQPSRAFLQKGSRGPLVRLTQEILNARGYYVDGEHIEEDSFYGPRTLKSVKRFQKDYGMEPNGRLGADDLHVLIGSYRISIEGNSAHEDGEPMGNPSLSSGNDRVGNPLDFLLGKLGLALLSVFLGSIAVVAINMGYLDKLPIEEIVELLSTTPPPPCPTAEHSRPLASNS